MFRFRRMGPSGGANLDDFVLAASAVFSLLGCMDDTVYIRGANAEESALSEEDPGNPGAPGGSEGVTQPGAAGTTPGAAIGEGGTVGGIAPQAQAAGGSACWQLPVADEARLLAPNGRAADLVGGKIVGSASSPTNGFVDLGVITAAPADGEWLTLSLSNATAHRYVKYYAPGGSYGVIAELELYSGDQRLEGASFGSAGSRDDAGTVFANALDGDANTFFEGPLPNDNYVGLDLGAGHELAAPTFSPPAGAAASGDLITITAPAGASVVYSTDGSDPATNGLPYTGAIALPAGNTLIKAVALSDCALPSPVAQSVYNTDAPLGGSPGPTPGVQSSMHIGNSLTDTINDLLPTLAADGGVALDYNRYTIPGAGTWLYEQMPTGGFGVADVQEALRTRAFDHLSLQPFPNMPCQPVASSDGNDSDSGYVNMAWSDALTQNPNVQLWVYQQWPAPADYVDCFTGGGWTRGDWQPEAPTSWEDAVAKHVVYQEAVRSALVSLHPEAPPPYIVPGGLALLALKHAIENGEVPGISDFFATLFQAGGEDIHMTEAGAYFISLVFYACLFQASPEGLPNETGGALSAEQATMFQRVAWQAVSGYPLSGVSR